MENESRALLAQSLRDELVMLSPLSSDCCIYRVPERLREINEKVYTPQVVSIGPLHHGSLKLQAMEKHKKMYLLDFLQRSQKSLEEFIQLIKQKEKRLRDCYAEEIELSSDSFVKMILLDAAFIIEILLRYSSGELRQENDHLFHKPYLIEDIWDDMWLIENQIPFFILEDLFNLGNITGPHSRRPTIIKLTYEYFKCFDAVEGNLLKFPPDNGVKVEHFTDFLRICHLPLQGPREVVPTGLGEVAGVPTVSELYKAGVKIKPSNSKNLFGIKFKAGVLEIPILRLQLESESIFRNLIAYELRHTSDNYFNDYVFTLHQLVNTPEDVELLAQHGVIENWLPDNESASTLLNNLYRGTTLLPGNFYFLGLCEDLSAYFRSSYSWWMINFKHKFFSTGWAGISVVFAIFLVVVVPVIQAVCSVIQVMSKPNCP